MKKILWLTALFCCLTGAVHAATMPDNLYFKAMNDEMQRTKKKLNLKGSPSPYYVLYKLQVINRQAEERASLGALYPRVEMENPSLTVSVLLSAGNAQQDSFGVEDNRWKQESAAGRSYEAIRHSLWTLTDEAYLDAREFYERKNSYRRKKPVQDNLPDFVPGPQGKYREEIPSFQPLDEETMQQWVREVSNKGNLPYVEEFEVGVAPTQTETYLLNNLGAWAQYSVASIEVRLRITYRTKDGFVYKQTETLSLDPASADWRKTASARVEQWLRNISQQYDAPKGTSYLGPALLMPTAAADLWARGVLSELSNFGTVIDYRGQEKRGGSLKDKKGMRIFSKEVDLFDRPFDKTYQGIVLKGFAPLDDEGTTANELTLVKEGILQTVPTSARPFKKGIRSNGHGRALRDFPRENLTNLFVIAKHPLSDEKLEEKLLDMCREAELEYCYILHSLNLPQGFIERIYTADGRKEAVSGLEFDSRINTRLLRDIRAAGEKSVVSNRKGQAIVTPALLLQEAELVPSDKKPERRPFISKP